MVTERPFIRRDHSTTEGFKTTPYFIRVVLNPDAKIYRHEYKGIEFFVCRSVVAPGWKATETKSGSTLDSYPQKHATKGACIADAQGMIDSAGAERVNELVEYVVEGHPFDAVMTQDEYMEWRTHNVMGA